MDLPPDFSDLLAEFARFEVRFALLGGYAVGYHAEPRATKDLDLLIAGAPENLERVARALESFGAPPNAVAGVRSMGENEIIYFGAPPLRIDLLRSADGIDTEEVLARAEEIRTSTLRIPVLTRDDLIKNKRAAGRPQDLADVVALDRFRDETR